MPVGAQVQQRLARGRGPDDPLRWPVGCLSMLQAACALEHHRRALCVALEAQVEGERRVVSVEAEVAVGPIAIPDGEAMGIAEPDSTQCGERGAQGGDDGRAQGFAERAEADLVELEARTVHRVWWLELELALVRRAACRGQLLQEKSQGRFGEDGQAVQARSEGRENELGPP